MRVNGCFEKCACLFVLHLENMCKGDGAVILSKVLDLRRVVVAFSGERALGFMCGGFEGDFGLLGRDAARQLYEGGAKGDDLVVSVVGDVGDGVSELDAVLILISANDITFKVVQDAYMDLPEVGERGGIASVP